MLKQVKNILVYELALLDHPLYTIPALLIPVFSLLIGLGFGLAWNLPALGFGFYLAVFRNKMEKAQSNDQVLLSVPVSRETLWLAKHLKASLVNLVFLIAMFAGNALAWGLFEAASISGRDVLSFSLEELVLFYLEIAVCWFVSQSVCLYIFIRVTAITRRVISIGALLFSGVVGAWAGQPESEAIYSPSGISSLVIICAALALLLVFGTLILTLYFHGKKLISKLDLA